MRAGIERETRRGAGLLMRSYLAVCAALLACTSVNWAFADGGGVKPRLECTTKGRIKIVWADPEDHSKGTKIEKVMEPAAAQPFRHGMPEHKKWCTKGKCPDHTECVIDARGGRMVWNHEGDSQEGSEFLCTCLGYERTSSSSDIADTGYRVRYQMVPTGPK